MRFAEIHTTAADASDLQSLVTDLSTSRGCRAGRRPPSRRCMRPPCRWCRPLSSASVSWSRGRRWRCSRPSRPTPTTGTRRRGTESRSPSLLCNIIIISVLHNITISVCVVTCWCHACDTSRRVCPPSSRNCPDKFPDTEFCRTQGSSSHDL